MFLKKLVLLLFLAVGFLACKKIHHTELITFTNEAYPDNPDLPLQSEMYNTIRYSDIRFIPEEKPSHFSVELIDEKNKQHKLILNDIDFSEYIPMAPSWIKGDAYLTKIGLINQEWNRQQVRFNRKSKQVKIAGNDFEEDNLVRIDLARNCLSSYNWEILLYADEDEMAKPYYHGWFTFPTNLYESLFMDKNELDFDTYATHMTQWQDPEEERINFNLLRTVLDTQRVSFRNYNDRMYPVSGERKYKKKNIISPINFNRIQDLLTDSTTFATFTEEGKYEKTEPRITELGRLAIVDSVWISKMTSPATTNEHPLHELTIFYTHATDSVKTELVIGGIDFQSLPRLRESEANNGWQNSMGIANHTFYSTYQHTLEHSCEKSPYYALTTDQYQNWVDSHKIGIDGPLLFLDKRNPRLLHIFILSFERHAFVGHYTVNLNQIAA